MTRRAADEKDEGSGREAVQVALEDVIVEEPLNRAVGNVEEFMRVVNEVLEKDVATTRIVLNEHGEIVKRGVGQPSETESISRSANAGEEVKDEAAAT